MSGFMRQTKLACSPFWLYVNRRYRCGIDIPPCSTARYGRCRWLAAITVTVAHGTGSGDKTGHRQLLLTIGVVRKPDWTQST